MFSNVKFYEKNNELFKKEETLLTKVANFT